MLTDQIIEKIIANMSREERAVIDAIQIASNRDEKAVVDAIIRDVQQRRARLFDVIKIDLAVDRSTTPLEISGGGTLLACIEATDNNANADVSLETEDTDTNRRFRLVRGKRIRLPYSRFYIYHAAQSGKQMKLLRAFSTKSLTAGYEDDSGEAANSDLVTALGNSSVIATAQVSVGTSSTLIKAQNLSRKRITIKVPASAANGVYIGVSGVTTANGHLLDAGDAITLNTTAAIYGDAAAATTVTYLEE